MEKAGRHCLIQVIKGHMTSNGTSHNHVPPDKDAVQRTRHHLWKILIENAQSKFNFKDISDKPKIGILFKITVLNFKSDKVVIVKRRPDG